MNNRGAEVETYLTIEELAVYLKLAEQTIRRWILNREIPYRQIKKGIRFRVSGIEKWVDGGGMYKAVTDVENDEGGLFGEENEVETEKGAGDERNTETGAAV
jgi:excisionase family DNA binding protein